MRADQNGAALKTSAGTRLRKRIGKMVGLALSSLALTAGLAAAPAQTASAAEIAREGLDVLGATAGFSIKTLSDDRYKVNLWVSDTIRDRHYCVFLRSTVQVKTDFWYFDSSSERATKRTRICDDFRTGTHRYTLDNDLSLLERMFGFRTRVKMELCEDRPRILGDRCVSYVSPSRKYSGEW